MLTHGALRMWHSRYELALCAVHLYTSCHRSDPASLVHAGSSPSEKNDRLMRRCRQEGPLADTNSLSKFAVS